MVVIPTSLNSRTSPIIYFTLSKFSEDFLLLSEISEDCLNISEDYQGFENNRRFFSTVCLFFFLLFFLQHELQLNNTIKEGTKDNTKTIDVFYKNTIKKELQTIT